ncbi:HAMP domain-containing protein [Hyphomicrobium sp. CS1GBMeth3]|uniref:HAMP domain-containing protein n=1 Tax=Hyphomicrobium sp. CS1GBMeth3 TaxID=1892845 RepID=UPI000AEDDEFB|nr:HAMP domain-containing protein [Hyphomicrobium sp. CS1GBMeth3]
MFSAKSANEDQTLRSVLTALEALASGDGSVRLPPETPGIAGDVARAFNALAERGANNGGSQAQPHGLTRLRPLRGGNGAGTGMRPDQTHLAEQAPAILEALIAIKKGDASARLPLDWPGIAGRIAETFNDIVELNGHLERELERLSRVAGKQGRLRERARLGAASGFWRTSIESVNSMIDDLVHPSSEVARVIGAVAQGDLTKTMPLEVEGRPLEGEFLRTAKVINTMVDQLRSFAAEVTRVAREVGTEGKLGGQADVKGASGTWRDLTDSVNFMAGNLTAQVRNIAEVTTAVARGDLSKKITVDVKGELLELKSTINTMVDQLSSFASEVTRVAREVGTEGKLGGQADVQGVSGTWRDLTENVNSMADNLTDQVRNIAEVTTAVARGDLSKKITVDVKGELLELKSTINTMVDQLSSFASEVTRMAREVGTEGKLGGQAEVQGVAGTWKDLTDSVNSMAGNLTAQVRNIAEVTTAVARGDLSKKIAVDAKGEILELKITINTMVDQLSSFAAEVTRVAREVGTDGKLGGQAEVQGVAGTWKTLTDSVNSMASNLTDQVRNIADVTTAVAMGDLSKKITVDVKGEILELKNTINTMVDQLRSFAAEVTRVAREVGTEGKLGGQADVPGVAGTWKTLTDSVNSMAGNLTDQVRNIAEVTTAVAMGDLSKKITVDVKGEILELKATINTMVDQLRSFAAEVTRVAREVGTEGKLGGQADVQGVAGTWKDLTESVNSMASNLTDQVRNIADVTTAVARGDLSKKITVDVKGEILELKNTINTMVDQLRSFAAEVTRVAREVGTEGKLGGQADVPGVAGTWKDLTDNVNSMAGNLTAQVRGIARVVTAVANGDLKHKLTVEAMGEIAALADTINSMTETLATFAEQVTSVAREVGVEGQLGGQAKVPGAAGTWKALTENVNQLAANLTTQVRAIAEVATAVTKGDLTREIAVNAEGEVAVLKDTINEMIRNLRDTTQKNTEQNWLKTNLAKFSRMLQGQKDLVAVGQMILSELAPVVGAHQAEVYVWDNASERPRLKLLASYASSGQGMHGKTVDVGAGLVGQCAQDKRRIVLESVPVAPIRIASGLTEAPPASILVLPIVFEGMVKGVLELASLERFIPVHHDFLDQLTESIGLVINTIEANMRTEDLLEQSQSLAKELQSRQLELQRTNEELQEKARLLAYQNQEVERKNSEVEQARQALEEKADQLARTSKYKSEFLANMSHELRTPLNSLLILSDQLCQNRDGNLTDRQVEYSKTIHASGKDLLTLINDILDLAKIESGTVAVDVGELRFDDLYHYVRRTFGPVAEQKSLSFDVSVDPRLPTAMVTDSKRLQQILKNLLSNAFKFTHQGRVALSIDLVKEGWSDSETLNRAAGVVAFNVTDTGIGISPEKQSIIFEAFQQADGSTSRKYGGTGLGLAISRELTRVLSGEMKLVSAVGKGSSFVLYLPLDYVPARSPRRAPEPAASSASQGGNASDAAAGGLEADYARDNVVRMASDPNEEPTVEDDRDGIAPGDTTILIVENDASFARVLLDTVREMGCKGIVAGRGRAALDLARERMPSAVTLDMVLPDLDGWRILDSLKSDLATRHIPVWIVSAEDARERALELGAQGFITKPLLSKMDLEDGLGALLASFSRKERRILVAAAPGAPVLNIVRAFSADDVQIIEANDRSAAVRLLSETPVDCLVVDGRLDLPLFACAEALRGHTTRAGSIAPLPVIVWSEQGAPRSSVPPVEAFTVRYVQSPERLVDLVSLALNRPVDRLPEPHVVMLKRVHDTASALVGKKVLVVDDDARNIFALATLLEDHGMDVVSATSGREALRLLNNGSQVDIVLMDIMMPDMDGIATIRAAQENPSCRELPFIAVTAKALKGDRERCIEAGAWDYLAKPVDADALLSVMRSWLYR